jgi:hypothetical protein
MRKELAGIKGLFQEALDLLDCRQLFLVHFILIAILGFLARLCLS